MSTPALRRRIASRLQAQQRLNDPSAEPRNRLPTLAPLRAWQAARLRGTFGDFLDDPRTRPAGLAVRARIVGARST